MTLSRRILTVLIVSCLAIVESVSAQTIDSNAVSSRILPAFQRPQPTTLFRVDSTLPPTALAITKRNEVDWTRVGITAGSLTAAITALHIYQLNAWWKDNRVPFHVFEDADYQVNFDKAGHTFGGYYSSFFFDQAYRWAGLDTGQAVLIGALSGALWEMYIEVEDGFARSWGFSRGDAKADILGAALYVVTQRVPYLKNLKYKWSYWPSYKLLENKPDIPGQTVTFIEDYTGQSYWLSMDVHTLLKDFGVKDPIWPSWINLALGVSGSELGPIDTTDNGSHAYDHRRLQWLVSLDYDLGSLIPESSVGFLNFVRRGLNYWHFPSPAWEISPEHRFFILFPLKMTIG